MSAYHLTADDRLDIFELPAVYAEALDTLQPELLRAVFTIDAVWEMEGRIRLDGLDEIMAFMGRPIHPGAHLMVNIHIANVAVDPVGGGPLVTLRSRGIYPLPQDDPREPVMVRHGRYEDDVVRTDAGWRIRHRRYRYGGS